MYEMCIRIIDTEKRNASALWSYRIHSRRHKYFNVPLFVTVFDEERNIKKKKNKKNQCNVLCRKVCTKIEYVSKHTKKWQSFFS